MRNADYSKPVWPDDPREPVPGRCNSPKAGQDGKLCRNLPVFPESMGGNGRCKFHGGLSTGPKTQAGKERVAENALKHGLYAARLRGALPLELQPVFDEAPTNTDLSSEIALTRTKLIQFSEMLAMGKRWIYTKGKGGSNNSGGESWSEGAISVDELVERGTEMLRRLVHTQHAMHPGKDLKGNLRITVQVSQAARDAGEKVPDLTEDGSTEADAPETYDAEGEAAATPLPEKGKLDDFLDD